MPEEKKSRSLEYCDAGSLCAAETEKKSRASYCKARRKHRDHWGGSILQKNTSIRHKKEETEKSNEWLGVKSVRVPLFTLSV